MTTKEKTLKLKIEAFRAWSKAGRKKMRLPNPLHDLGGTASFAFVREPRVSRARGIAHADLDAELQAWSDASDEDFEHFEQSLE